MPGVSVAGRAHDDWYGRDGWRRGHNYDDRAGVRRQALRLGREFCGRVGIATACERALDPPHQHLGIAAGGGFGISDGLHVQGVACRVQRSAGADMARSGACAHITAKSGCAISTAMAAAWKSADAAARGATALICTRRCRRAVGADVGAGVAWMVVVTASKSDKQDNIRELLVCAPVPARRESPNAAWATRSIGSCLA